MVATTEIASSVGVLDNLPAGKGNEGDETAQYTTQIGHEDGSEMSDTDFSQLVEKAKAAAMAIRGRIVT